VNVALLLIGVVAMNDAGGSKIQESIAASAIGIGLFRLVNEIYPMKGS